MNSHRVLPASEEPDPELVAARAAEDVAAYQKRKGTIALRALLFGVPLIALLLGRNPHAALTLAVGLACGVANMLLIMRANERLLAGRTRMGGHTLGNMGRIFTVGAIALWTTSLGPAWMMGIFFVGFFLPLALYAFELQRCYKSTTYNGLPR